MDCPSTDCQEPREILRMCITTLEEIKEKLHQEDTYQKWYQKGKEEVEEKKNVISKKYKIITHKTESHEWEVYAKNKKEAYEIILWSINSQYIWPIEWSSHKEVLETKE